jgi:hypothetical protein
MWASPSHFAQSGVAIGNTLGTNFLKNERNFLNRKTIMHAFAWIVIQIFDLHYLM